MKGNPNSLSLSEHCALNKEVGQLISYIEDAVALSKIRARIFDEITITLQKQAHQFMEYDHPDNSILRNHELDRVFPLETVEIQRFQRENTAKMESAFVHTGPAADEFARSLNALAVTIGKDIYFRNNAYNLTHEEGRKLIAHELTHVQQYEEKRIAKHTSVQELENEAISAEQKEEYNHDPFISVEVDNEMFRLRKSHMKKIHNEMVHDIEYWIKDQKNCMDDNRYLSLLQAYQKWREEVI